MGVAGDMKKSLTCILTVAFMLLFTTTAKADINYDLLYNWSYQPNNVQWDLVGKNTNIQVVDKLDWESPDLYETYGYTTMKVIPGSTIVSGIDVRIKKGYESSLTHEVGHCLSNYKNNLYWWCYRPEFITIWQQERMNCPLLVGQGLTDIREYFACAYDAYIRYPQILKKTCPMTYNYIQVVLKYT